MPPSDAALATAPDDEHGAVVVMEPPPRERSLALARLLVDVFARRALADLGLIAVDESPGDGIVNDNRK